jgi:hypothetical protein
VRADHRIEQLLVERIRAAFPGDAVRRGFGDSGGGVAAAGGAPGTSIR